ncbi:hypothetical protein IWZ00DRAFT_334787 [Phyllosticta capitalensis]
MYSPLGRSHQQPRKPPTDQHPPHLPTHPSPLPSLLHHSISETTLQGRHTHRCTPTNLQSSCKESRREKVGLGSVLSSPTVAVHRRLHWSCGGESGDYANVARRREVLTWKTAAGEFDSRDFSDYAESPFCVSHTSIYSTAFDSPSRIPEPRRLSHLHPSPPPSSMEAEPAAPARRTGACGTSSRSSLRRPSNNLLFVIQLRLPTHPPTDRFLGSSGAGILLGVMWVVVTPVGSSPASCQNSSSEVLDKIVGVS